MIKLPKIIENNLEIKIARSVNTYLPNFGMSFVSSDNKQVTKFESCRDYMHDQVRAFINDKKNLASDSHSYNPKLGDPDIFIDRLRLLIAFKIDQNSKNNGFYKIRESLRALNTIEKYANMELTVGESIKLMKNHGDEHKMANYHLILLRGSGEYMRNPHLLSALTLMLRFYYLNDRLIKFKKEDDFNKLFNKLNKCKECKMVPVFKDKILMKECSNLLHIVFKNRYKIFKDKDLKQLFPVGIGQDFHSKGGIYSLCLLSSPNKDVNAKFSDIISKEV